MTPYSILSSFLENDIIDEHSKSKWIRNDNIFTDTIVQLLNANADTHMIAQVLELYSHYKDIFIQDLNPLYIRQYLDLENKLRNQKQRSYGGGMKAKNITNIAHSLYHSWLTNEKARLDSIMTNEEVDNQEINTQSKDIFYKLGVIYGALLQFLKDAQVELSGNELSGNDLKITGFVDENNEFVSLCNLTKYASSVISLIDSSLELFINKGVLDMKLFKPLLTSLGIDLDFIENTYNDAMLCIQEFQNMLKKRNRIAPEEFTCKEENKSISEKTT